MDAGNRVVAPDLDHRRNSHLPRFRDHLDRSPLRHKFSGTTRVTTPSIHRFLAVDVFVSMILVTTALMLSPVAVKGVFACSDACTDNSKPNITVSYAVRVMQIIINSYTSKCVCATNLICVIIDILACTVSYATTISFNCTSNFINHCIYTITFNYDVTYSSTDNFTYRNIYEINCTNHIIASFDRTITTIDISNCIFNFINNFNHNTIVL